jgi:hypothetical protein
MDLLERYLDGDRSLVLGLLTTLWMHGSGMSVVISLICVTVAGLWHTLSH